MPVVRLNYYQNSLAVSFAVRSTSEAASLGSSSKVISSGINLKKNKKKNVFKHKK